MVITSDLNKMKVRNQLDEFRIKPMLYRNCYREHVSAPVGLTSVCFIFHLFINAKPL